MYTITATVRCPIEHSELDMTNPDEAALALEQAVTLRLLSCLGMVIVGSIQTVSRQRHNPYAFTVLLVLHCPDSAAAALREDPERARAHVARQLEQGMRELCRRATVERLDVTHAPCDAEWGEANAVQPELSELPEQPPVFIERAIDSGK